MQLQQSGRLEEAKAVYGEVLAEQPAHADALHLSGLASMQLGRHEEAVRLIGRAVDLVPQQPVLRNNFGLALHKAGLLKKARAELIAALDLRPGYAGAHMNLAAVFSELGERALAMEHGQQAVELDPERAEGWYNLGLYLIDEVRLQEGAEAFRKALSLKPDYSAASHYLLYTLNMIPELPPESVAAEHARVMRRRFGSPPPPLPGPFSHRKTRIAYVSADFCRHAVNHFFEPLLDQHDRSRFEVYCYANVATPDDVTRRLRERADRWCDVSSLEDEEMFARVLQDEVDILVDLTGHTKGNRLAVFARRAAPLQVSWLGYPNTTGLGTMDLRVLDAYTAAAPGARAGTERPLLLPDVFACFRPSELAPEVSPPPAMTQGAVTLGSFHKLEKINHRVVACWAGILRANPDTRLLLMRDELDGWHRDRLSREFQAHGARPAQLELVKGREGADSFQEWFAEIDILLDTFPWSGHTMACHALWMGVPRMKQNTAG
jgi:predicted O-linked N-acetylglucosamine transferase (SPINDLY family)